MTAINSKDLDISTYQTWRGGFGPVRNNGVKILHVPTGIVVSCASERSQHLNRALAMKELMDKLDKKADQWVNLLTLADVAAAQAAGEEIEFQASRDWNPWSGGIWNADWKFRARPAQPKRNKVKILGWVNHMSGATMTTGSIPFDFEDSDWIRYPKLDDEIEVPE